jgi:hypothetical protein
LTGNATLDLEQRADPRNRSRAMAEPLAFHTSKNLRRTCAQQATSVTLAGLPSALSYS